MSLICLAAGLAGCCDPRHKQAVGERVDGMASTLQAMGKQEIHRGKNLRKTLDLAARECGEDVQRTSEAPAVINDRIQEDLEHWQNREPYRRRVFQEQIEGHPANIERDLPRVLY
ncbi:MAG TPA: hypothetical protein PKY77_18905 [Phycisphaerae bacterium]|nr:hypothetical protein [Phycisphaerae bacterium]HRY68468.1 hypothetical protein [Phycisphaerae bacterium]HSA28496.1 hypothetical protein [Phycisphaerae bacterium]